MPLSPGPHHPDVPELLRERLIQPMLDTTVPLIVLVGPPGSGKTTLLRQLSHRCAQPVRWWRPALSPDGNLETSFDLEAILTEASRDLARRSGAPEGGSWVMVDQTHQMSDGALAQALGAVLARRTPGLRCIVAARRAPPIDVAAQTLAGNLTMIGPDDLRFRPREVEELFDEPSGELTTRNATRLSRGLDGWAAGLRLLQLATTGRPAAERDALIAGAGFVDLVWPSFEAQWLAATSEQDWSFLVACSSLGVLTPALVEALVPDRAGARRLADLAHGDLLIPVPGERVAYRAHAVLRAQLPRLLTGRLDRAAWLARYDRAGRLLEADGWPRQAVQAFARAERWDDVARLLRSGSMRLSDDTVDWLAGRWPSDGSIDPGLQLGQAAGMLRRGAAEPARRAFRQAALAAGDTKLRRRARNGVSAAGVWLRERAPITSPSTTTDPDLRTAVEVRQAGRGSPSPEPMTTLLGRVVTALLHAHFDQALAALEELPETEDPEGFLALGARLARLIAELATASERASPRSVEQLIDDCDRADQPWLSRQARAARQVPIVARDPVGASRRLEVLSTQCRRDEDPWGVMAIGLLTGLAGLLAAPPVGGSSRSAAGDDWRGTTDRLMAAAAAVAVDLDASVVASGLEMLRTASRFRTQVRAIDMTWSQDPAPAPADPVTSIVESPEVGSGEPARSDELCCLGGFSIRARDRYVDLTGLRPRPRAVLMMLAMRAGRAVHREHLVDLFWRESDVASGVRALQVAVAQIRRALRPYGVENALQRVGETYQLRLPGVVDQLAEFERLAGRCDRNRHDRRVDLDRRLAAVEAYGGELLPEAGPAEWVVDERERLRWLAARLAAEAAELALELGEFGVGVRAAQRSLTIDPHTDRPWLLLIELQQAMGDVRAAEQTRRDHARAEQGWSS